MHCGRHSWREAGIGVQTAVLAAVVCFGFPAHLVRASSEPRERLAGSVQGSGEPGAHNTLMRSMPRRDAGAHRARNDYCGEYLRWPRPATIALPVKVELACYECGGVAASAGLISSTISRASTSARAARGEGMCSRRQSWIRAALRAMRCDSVAFSSSVTIDRRSSVSRKAT